MAATAMPRDVSLNLALAVIRASDAPLLLLDQDLTILAASTSFCTAFEIRPEGIADFKVYELGRGEWDRPQLHTLLKAVARGAAPVPAYEMNLVREGRSTRELVIHVQKLAYGPDEDARLIVTIADMTDARASGKQKDDLLREKGVLLQELQHRVANSLQIIASVLLQNARQVQSEETRGHLRDAHNRLMSVAALQKQLHASGLGNVELRSYLTDLCESIGASMIRDGKHTSLRVNTDETMVSATVSVSLGLIVTELVINSLKHAFPDGRAGQITVDYQASGPNWTLTVADNGVGILHSSAGSKPGLGTSIVEALAKQLEARIEVADAGPGTLVRLIHPRTPSAVMLRTVGRPPV